MQLVKEEDEESFDFDIREATQTQRVKLIDLATERMCVDSLLCFVCAACLSVDSTKIIPEDLVPVRYIGEMTLDRIPADFFAETEQVAFCTANIIPGIDFTHDPLLQGRNFSYLDTQLSRLGSVNFNQIP